MSEYLFIRPNLSLPRNYEWFAYDDASGNVLSSGHVSSIEDFARNSIASPERMIALLYPASAVKFTTITYPGKLKKGAYNSLLYVIEDDFIDDIEDYSVRVLNKQGTNYDVLIYKHNELINIEKALYMLGFPVDIIVPDVLTLPLPGKNDEGITGCMMRLGNSWLIRDSKNSGKEVPNEWFDLFVAGEADNHKYISLSELPDNLQDKWKEELVESPYAVLAEGAIKNRLNLSTKQRKINYHIKFIRSWSKVAVMIILMLILWFMNISYKTKAITQEASDYRNQQRTLLSQIINTQNRVDDPVAKMREIVENSSPIGTDEGFVDLAKIITPYISSKRDIEIVSLKFERVRKQFTIQFLANESFDTDKFISGLSPDFTGSIIDTKPSRDRKLSTVQLRRTKQ